MLRDSDIASFPSFRRTCRAKERVMSCSYFVMPTETLGHGIAATQQTIVLVAAIGGRLDPFGRLSFRLGRATVCA